MQSLGFWIVELGEYGRTLSAEKADSYKAFITNSNDVFRVPYGRSAEKHPRTTAFYATTDSESFLKDDAGERRNWILPVIGIDDVDIDIDQLWGEVTHLAIVEKMPHWLNQNEIAKLNAQNEAFKIRSGEYEKLHNAFDWQAGRDLWICLTSAEVCGALGIDTQKAPHIGRALMQMKHLGVAKNPDNSHKKYFVPPFKSADAMRYVKNKVKGYMLRAPWMGDNV